jgi:hypothetical protein
VSGGGAALRGKLIGAAVAGGALGQGFVWSTATLYSHVPPWEYVLLAWLGFSLVGALLGGGLGLPVGSVVGAWSRSPPPASHAEHGLSRLDLVLIGAYGLAACSLVLVLALVAADGSGRRLCRWVLEASPQAGLLPRTPVLLGALGTTLIACVLPVAAWRTLQPPLRRLGRAHTVGVTLASFLTGVLWIPLALSLADPIF